MSTDKCLAALVRRNWLVDGPLNDIVPAYIETLRAQRYDERTISCYLGALAHFSHWIMVDQVAYSSIDTSLIQRFLQSHLPACTCPAPCYGTVSSAGAALRHLLRRPEFERTATAIEDPISIELAQFGEYLSNTCGLAPVTRITRVKHVGALLAWAFGTQVPMLSRLSVGQLDEYVAGLSLHLRPVSLRGICNCLRSYFRYRALQGESTDSLSAALPRFADWRRSTLPKTLSDTELNSFLSAFDFADPVGLRDYAIARCLVDLGLRGNEVTDLTLDSLDWRSGTLTILSTKSKRVQQLPLPVSTGEAIATYLHQGRPQTIHRELFVRHRAPFDKPLSVPAIRNAMNRAFIRCGLRERFCNTHVLRRTTATRLQRSGASIKEIADLLRHQSLDTASNYARVDLDGLRAAPCVRIVEMIPFSGISI